VQFFGVARAEGWIAIAMAFAGCHEVQHSDRNQSSSEPQTSEVRAVTVDYLELREHPWMVDGWGLTRGDRLKTTGEILPDGGLHVEIEIPKVFTGTNVVLEIRNDADHRLSARATVTFWSDEGSTRRWAKPTGSIYISSADWTRLHDPKSPRLLLEIRLHDDPMREDTYVRGIVEVPGSSTSVGT
jgi:hypothetical protein